MLSKLEPKRMTACQEELSQASVTHFTPNTQNAPLTNHAGGQSGAAADVSAPDLITARAGTPVCFRAELAGTSGPL